MEPLEALLAPIGPDHPGGPDLALAPELDEIREARRGEDAGLAQGEWRREVRGPQWPRVRELCAEILAGRSKDLQVACWHAEALARLQGLPGLALGLETVSGLLARFWDSLHPALEDGAAEARAGRIEWLDLNLAQVVRQIPLTADGTGGHPWLKWQEARAVDNLGLRDPQARDAALAEGKLSLEAFHKAALGSGAEFYARAQAAAEAAQAALAGLQDQVERRFGAAGPGLDGLAEALQDCLALIAQLRQRHFPGPARDPGPAAAPEQESAPAGSRAEAIRTLRATAAWFRAAEPHSPVAPLLARAANWAEMGLEAWLAEVVKDAPTLAQLRELLQLQPGPERPGGGR